MQYESYTIFKHGETQETCGGAPVEGIAISRDNYPIQYFCFAYKGDIKPLNANSIKSFLKVDMGFIDANGQYQIAENQAFTSPALFVDPQTKDEWKYTCFDLWSNFKKRMNVFNKKSEVNAGDDNGAHSHRILEIRIDLNQDIDSFAFFDHVSFSADKPLYNDDSYLQIIPAVGPKIESMSWSEVEADTYEIDIIPGACATGHELIGFYSLENDWLEKNHFGWTKFRRTSWPTDTYLLTKRIQASSSSLLGTMHLKYDNMDRAVKLDVSTKDLALMASDIVTSYAIAGFETFITFNQQPTCTSFSFDVEFTRPGGNVKLPTISGIDHLTVASEVTTEGYEQYPIDMTWFMSAHRQPQVQVFIDGINSECAEFCDFEYDPVMNPTANDVSFPDTIIPGQSEIIIRGDNLPEWNWVRPKCTITKTEFVPGNYPEVEQTCLVDIDQETGTFTLDGYDTKRGRPTNIGDYTVSITFDVSSINPAKIVNGGGITTIIGSGLSCNQEVYTLDNDGNKQICQVNQNNCKFDSLTVECESTEIGQKLLYLDGTSSGLSIDFEASARVTSIVNADGDSESDVYITQVAAQEFITLLCDMNDGGFGNDKTALKIFVAEHRIFALSDFSATSMTFQLPVLEPGAHKISILKENVGYLVIDPSIKVKFKVSALSRSSGSMYGGGKITLTGIGYTVADESDLIVTFDGNEAKDVEVFSDTLLTLTVPSSAKTEIIDVHLDLKNQVTWDSDIEIYAGDSVRWDWDLTTQVIDMKMKICQSDSTSAINCLDSESAFTSGTESTKKGNYLRQFNVVGTYFVTTGCMTVNCKIYKGCLITVVARPAEIESEISVKIAGFDHSSSNNRKWTYQGANTGLIKSTNVDSTGISVTDDIVLTGENFKSLNSWSVTVGDYNCIVNSVTEEEISCKVDTSQTPILLESFPIKMFNEHGDAGILTETIQGGFVALKPVVSNIISSQEGSLNGGSKLVLDGFGLDTDGTQVLLDSFSECTIIEQSYTRITCLTPGYGTGDPAGADASREIVLISPSMGVFPNDIADPNFYYQQSKTPSITEITVGQVTYTNSNRRKRRSANAMSIIEKGTTISWSISGASPGDLSVYVNDIECVVSGSSCDVGDSLVGGPVSIRFSDSTYGDAFISDSLGLNLLAPSKMISVTPDKGSIYGGNLITVTGSGFTDQTIVNLNGIECDIQSMTTSEITCLTPIADDIGVNELSAAPAFENTLFYSYEEESTPVVTRINKKRGISGEDIVLSGSSLGSTTQGSKITFDGVECIVQSAAETTLTCTLGSKAGGPINEIGVYIHEHGTGRVEDWVKFSYILAVDGISVDRISAAGGVTIDVSGNGFSEASVLYLCEEELESTFISESQIRFVAPPSENFRDRFCEITVASDPTFGDFSATFRNLRYDSRLMPTIRSVSPERGGTAGGTVITVIGYGFASIQNPEVWISDSICGDLDVKSDTQLTCITGPLPIGSKQEAKVEIKSPSGDAANDDTSFWFIDRWSSKYTWGGTEPPQEGEMVVINEGQTVMVDGSTEVVKIILVDGGHIIFDPDQDCHLKAENILVTNGGSIIAGSETEPYDRSLVIEMYGRAGDLELPVYGAKTLAVRDGLVSLHGLKKQPTWTLLTETVNPGDTQIKLLDAVNWKVGDKIVVASTGGQNSWEFENEERTISSIDASKKIISFDDPLAYEHLGHIETLENGKTLDMRGEVGVLTRNVIFKGDDNALVDSFGGCLMVGPTDPGTDDVPSLGNMQLTNVEFYQVGQIFRLARYPIHSHFMGITDQSYIKEVAVHTSYNRAVVFHHTDNLLLDNSFVFNIMGGAVFIEDGIERFNQVTNNLVVKVIPSSSLQLDDITPAAIWVTNPNNIINYNRVAGCSAFGIWYRMHHHPEAGSYTTEICQQHEPFGECHGNVIHSVGKIALWFFETYAPYEGAGRHGSCKTDVIKQGLVDGVQTYRAFKGIEFWDTGAMQVKDAVIAECEFSSFEVKRILEVSLDEDKAVFVNGATIAFETSKTQSTHRNYPTVGMIQAAQSGLLVANTDFIGWGQEPANERWTSAFGGVFVPCIHYLDSGAFQARTKNIGWYSTQVKLKSRWNQDVQILDLDGTFAGDLPRTTYMSDKPGLYDQYGCVAMTDSEGFITGDGVIKCPNTKSWHHLRFLDPSPSDLKSAGITITIGAQTWDWSAATAGMSPQKGGYRILIPNNEIIEIEFQGVSNLQKFETDFSLLDMEVGSWNILKWKNVQCAPDNFRYLDDYGTASSGPLTAASNDLEYWHDSGSETFSVMFKNDGTKPWNIVHPVHKFHGNMLRSLSENSDGVRPFVQRFGFESCCGPCDLPTPTPPAQPPFNTIPTERPAEALFSSKLPFGEQISVSDYGYFRPTEEGANLVIRRGENLYVKGRRNEKSILE